MARRVSLLILVFLALTLSAGAQLREIDSSRLPPDEAVQTAYRSLLPTPEFYRPNDVIQRLPGTIYYFVTADGNEDIYSNTRAEFIATMKSLEIDAK